MNHIPRAAVVIYRPFDLARQDMLLHFQKLIDEGKSSDDLKAEIEATTSAMHQLLVLGC